MCFFGGGREEGEGKKKQRGTVIHFSCQVTTAVAKFLYSHRGVFFSSFQVGGQFFDSQPEVLFHLVSFALPFCHSRSDSHILIVLFLALMILHLFERGLNFFFCDDSGLDFFFFPARK